MTTEIFKKRRLGIKTAIVVSMLWVVCGVCSNSCGAAILTDDFNDNLTGDLWSVGNYTEKCTESAFGLYEAYQRLEYRATLTSSESYAEEFYYSRQCWPDVNQDFAFKINYHTTLLPWQCVMMWIGMTPSTQIVVDTDQSYLIAAGCCEGVNYYAWSGVGDQGDFKSRSANDGTLYISYTAAADTLYLSYTGYGPTNAWQTLSGVLKGQWGGVPIRVVLGGTAMGAGTVSAGQFYLDNFVLDSGVVSYAIVPNVVDLPRAEAESEISSAGLTVGSVQFIRDTSIPAGHVVSQWPAPETVVIAGSAVNLVVSLGSSITIPDVTGLSLADARSAITSAGFTVGTIAASYHPSVPKGLIISQSPPAGQSASIGTSVNLVQSNGRHYAGGSGAAEDPFMISIPQDLIELAASSTDWGKCFILTADIDMSAYTGIQYGVIGNNVTNFSGSFDGNGHIIRNLTYSTNYSHSYIGLFGYANNAIIKNIGIENVNISSNGDFLGGIIGCMKSGSVDNCYSTGSLKGRCRVGGLVGVMSNSTMTNCYSASNVSGLSDVGGLMGLCSDSYSLILNCYSLGDVTGTSTSVGGLIGNNGASIANCCSMSNVTGSYDSRVLGGLVGYNSGSICNSSCTGNVVGDDYVGGLVGYQYTGSVINCYSNGNVTGDSYIGGLVGYQRDCSDTAIEKCYSTGKVTGNNKKGGLLGYQSGSSSRVAACFWDIETSGMTDGVGNMNPAPGDVEGKTTAEMQMLSTFMDAGWDFTDTDADAAEWWMPSNHYPLLSWDRYGGGFGTLSMPYQIWTAEQMNAIGAAPDDWDKHFKLMADMDMSAYTGTQYHVIGNSTTKFTGFFDGDGHKISNLTYSTSKAVECLGLFGRVENAVIKNLALDDVSLASGSGNVGGLVGWNDSGMLSVCSVTGSIRGTGHLGGLVGRNDAGSLTACYASCSINGTSIIGGLVGGNYSGSIKDCYATGSVAGTGSFIGGLTGYNNKGKLATCYAADSVGEAGTRIGGLVGWNSTDSEVIACFWDTQASGKSAGVGGGSSSGIMGKTTAEMKMFMTFIDAEWTFTNTGIGWLMLRPNEDYPRLSWQEIYAGDIVGMYGVDLADYEVLARYWMHTDCPAMARCENADLDGNGAVDLIDYSILVENWMRQ